jgi:hypothetical protein
MAEESIRVAVAWRDIVLEPTALLIETDEGGFLELSAPMPVGTRLVLISAEDDTNISAAAHVSQVVESTALVEAHGGRRGVEIAFGEGKTVTELLRVEEEDEYEAISVVHKPPAPAEAEIQASEPSGPSEVEPEAAGAPEGEPEPIQLGAAGRVDEAAAAEPTDVAAPADAIESPAAGAGPLRSASGPMYSALSPAVSGEIDLSTLAARPPASSPHDDKDPDAPDKVIVDVEPGTPAEAKTEEPEPSQPLEAEESKKRKRRKGKRGKKKKK